MTMKGIILAGGSGSRLHPMTSIQSKHLLPVYDKPMIYYPLATLMLGGIRDIMIISTPRDIPDFQRLLSDGSNIGISLSYMIQPSPAGLPEAFILGRDFISDDSVTLVLGDNIFQTPDFGQTFNSARISTEQRGIVNLFGAKVDDPERFGVADLDEKGKLLRIIEKPENPSSNIAVTGLYMYDNSVCQRAESLVPSARGELEITDLNMTYIDTGNAQINLMESGSIWMDAGTPDSLLAASKQIHSIQKQGIYVACLEEIAFKKEYIDRNEFESLIMRHEPNSAYLMGRSLYDLGEDL